MSLYHEAAKVLEGLKAGSGSIKSQVYSKKDWKTDPKTLYALSTEAAKWSEVLSEVVERSGVLKVEKQLTPTLAIVLVHDLFLSKRGIALPATHGLNTTVSKHKVRLSAELTKARLRRGCATLDALRAIINGQQAQSLPDGTAGTNSRAPRHPRWVRINTLKTTVTNITTTTFREYRRVKTLKEVLSSTETKVYCYDEHISHLIAVHPAADITKTEAYRDGQLILQDKASCFPAYLLSPHPSDGDIIDTCAAPGNKTTHLAAELLDHHVDGNCENVASINAKIIACEKDAVRSLTLQKMVKLAGADSIIRVKAKQDFMRLDPNAPEFANVTALLLDPSCSGSGIVGRDEGGITVHLPSLAAADSPSSKRGKKRKRTDITTQTSKVPVDVIAVEQEEEVVLDDSAEKLKTRLANLSSFQLRLVERAMSFPAAKRITYSTCSVHGEENEHVVIRALLSEVARTRGWRIMRRQEQIQGLQIWPRRGLIDACTESISDYGNGSTIMDAEEVAEACIRCVKGTEEGTMGFFVAGFVRDDSPADAKSSDGLKDVAPSALSDDEWSGFDD